MCGIGGLIVTGNNAAPSEVNAIDAFEAIRNRGPDDFGLYHQPILTRSSEFTIGRTWPGKKTLSGITLLHRRLSILDTQSTGWQPMTHSDTSLVIVFNGEIYNYRELKDELTQLGHTFTSTSDTEVLLHAYSEWGTNCFTKLVGMFAFAILDKKKNTIILARDFLGLSHFIILKHNLDSHFSRKLNHF